MPSVHCTHSRYFRSAKVFSHQCLHRLFSLYTVSRISRLEVTQFSMGRRLDMEATISRNSRLQRLTEIEDVPAGSLGTLFEPRISNASSLSRVAGWERMNSRPALTKSLILPSIC